VVSIAFDMETAAIELSSARLYELSHLKPIIDSQAVQLVRSREAFCEAVNAYLDDRTIDGHARALARRDFLTFSDGGGAERIAAAIGGMS